MSFKVDFLKRGFVKVNLENQNCTNNLKNIFTWLPYSITYDGISKRQNKTFYLYHFKKTYTYPKNIFNFHFPILQCIDNDTNGTLVDFQA